MRRQCLVITLCVLAVAAVLYSEYEKGYPVYNGEELLETDVYPFRFVFFGDNRPEAGKEQPEVFKNLVQMINEDDPLFVVGGGDFVVEGTPENFEAFLDVISGLKSPLFYVCGNHDDSEYYEEYLGDRVYAFTYQNSLFVVLDNSGKVLDDDQLSFLEEQLKKKYDHTFVIMHCPPIDPEGSYTMLNPERFMEIVLKYEVDYVLCSHIHTFYEEKIGSTMFIISGGAGAPLYREGFHHYIIIEVGEDITYTVVRT